MHKKTLLVFCLKIALLLVILYGVDRLLGAAFIGMKDVALNRNPYHEWTKSAYILEKCDAECMVVGSSKAEHSYITEILTDSLGMNIYNGGQGGCFFLYQNCVISMLLDNNRIPKKIIWDIQPDAVLKESTLKEYQNVRYLSPYYDVAPQVKAFVDAEDERASIKMQCHMFRYNTKLLQYVLPIFGIGSTTKGGYLALPNIGYKYPQIATSISMSNSVLTGFNDYKLNVFKQTLKKCKEKGVNLVIFVSPSYSIKGKAYKSSVMKLAEVAQDYDFQLYDYSSDKRFLSDSTLFKDVNHLNDKGARVYTYIVAEVLQNYTLTASETKEQ